MSAGRTIALAAAALACAAAAPRATLDPPRTVAASDARLVRTDGVLRLAGVPFTGRVVDGVDGGRSETPYVRGVRDGVARAWYADGRPAWVRAYRTGREDGDHAAWWPGGTPRLEEHFVRGRLEGRVREWFANGRLYRDFRYRRGQEDGAQHMWYADGTLRASYVVRDGRRWGLLGAKGCTGHAPASGPTASRPDPTEVGR
jgi:hypothetical protein